MPHVIAIRKTEGREWADTRTLSGLLEASRDYASREDRDAGPHWVEANLVVRFATVEIVEEQLEPRRNTMERIAMTDGTGAWFNLETATEFKESVEWNGQNNISKATGSQTEHENLYLTAGGKWVLHCWSQWQGVSASWGKVSEEFAIAWLITNERTNEEIKNKQIAQLVDSGIAQLEI